MRAAERGIHLVAGIFDRCLALRAHCHLQGGGLLAGFVIATSFDGVGQVVQSRRRRCRLVSGVGIVQSQIAIAGVAMHVRFQFRRPVDDPLVVGPVFGITATFFDLASYFDMQRQRAIGNLEVIFVIGILILV